MSEDISFGASYVPPTQSKYFSDEENLNLESEITSVSSNNGCVIITGDVHAMTAKINDYVIGETLSHPSFLIERIYCATMVYAPKPLKLR